MVFYQYTGDSGGALKTLILLIKYITYSVNIRDSIFMKYSSKYISSHGDTKGITLGHKCYYL